MMRVEINMGVNFRGMVEKYAKDNDLSMPEAYRRLIEAGLIANGVDLDVIENKVKLPGDVQTVLELDDSEYEIVIMDGD